MPAAHRGVARTGLVAKGVLYLLLALLALQIALGNGADADSQGALRAVAGRPFGSAMLGALALGFAGYAGWQFYKAFSGDGWLVRLTAAVRGVVWSVLAISAARFIFAGSATRPNAEQSITARLLATPFGPWLVGAVGVTVAVIGLSFLRHLRDGRYFDDLKSMPQGTRRIVSAVTITGIGAKSGVYVMAGLFLVRAAVDHKASTGAGLDGALSTVAQQPYGTYVLAAVAGGLASYALWCWVRARYENVEHSDG